MKKKANKKRDKTRGRFCYSRWMVLCTLPPVHWRVSTAAKCPSSQIALVRWVLWRANRAPAPRATPAHVRYGVAWHGRFSSSIGGFQKGHLSAAKRVTWDTRYTRFCLIRSRGYCFKYACDAVFRFKWYQLEGREVAHDGKPRGSPQAIQPTELGRVLVG